jgi:hypothetical protein
MTRTKDVQGKNEIDNAQKSLRKELEVYVIAWNTCLRDRVKLMSPVLLLRNAHPAFRSDFAAKLKELGLLKEEESKEFIKFVR